MTWLAAYVNNWIYCIISNYQGASVTSFGISWSVFALTDWKGQMSQCIDCLLTLHIFSHWVFFVSLSTVSSFSLETQYHTQCSRGFSFGSVKLFLQKSSSATDLSPMGLSSSLFFFKMPTQSQKWRTLGLSMPRTLWWWKERAPV